MKRAKSSTRTKEPSSPHVLSQSRNVLVLQGGGALGAYQAGVYEALAAQDLIPDWIAGISIGAINAAIIAGNAPDIRVEKLRDFWHTVSSGLMAPPTLPGDHVRSVFNDSSATIGAIFGLPGFFQPRLPSPVLFPPGNPQSLSLYDTEPLLQTLERLIDFERINSGNIRLSVGAVNVRSGNFSYFDSKMEPLGPQHIMASGALPPGFPPVEINDQLYWDGGIVSNTPLQYVLDEHPRPHMSIFQVDLFNANGAIPSTFSEVSEREKDIRFSSRTRLNTDDFRRVQDIRRTAKRLLDKLPAKMKNDPDVKRLRELSCGAEITILQLIHRAKNYHSNSKDYEFSRHSVEEHWRSGHDDLLHSVMHEEWAHRDPHPNNVQVFDLARE